ncbi:ABC transporter G family member 40 [Hondaea fermentalgiana]|uniref:ABC transporter G family member 40 n=1 Tax=Hondaea fermentalgiana TaxID=2315210 RepID=A0A2R5GCE5_9STRA|nr:ABC transporter G family member 40 [Hondaea fermentalgiana]|eukprot:GBG26263.1 ABC transporter G family member 40 [Hondaea fermentalgiana]
MLPTSDAAAAAEGADAGLAPGMETPARADNAAAQAEIREDRTLSESDLDPESVVDKEAGDKVMPLENDTHNPAAELSSEDEDEGEHVVKPEVEGRMRLMGGPDQTCVAEFNRAMQSLDLSADLLEQLATSKLLIELEGKIRLDDISSRNKAKLERYLNAVARRFSSILDESEDFEGDFRADRAKRLQDGLQVRASRILSTHGSRMASEFEIQQLLRMGVEEHFRQINRLIFDEDEHVAIDVHFEDLHFEVKETESSLPQWLRGKSTVVTNFVNIFALPVVGIYDSIKRRCCAGNDRGETKVVLNKASGVFKAGDMTLLLGAAGSGKTSLMYAINDRLKDNATQTFSGKVRFNDYDTKDINVPNLATYVSQVDRHIPVLTVRETLEFASKCRSRKNWLDRVQEIRGREVNDRERAQKHLDNNVETCMALLGLTRAADTVIGNATLKGVSGGERRRVTLGEMLVVGSKVLLLDEISTGLDSAATYDITKTIKNMCKIFKSTAVVSLLQPPPETFDLFDQIVLMSEGSVIYHGPRVTILEYFEKLGYACPKYKDPADYLQELPTNLGENYIREDVDRASVPRTSEEFAACFRESEHFANMRDYSNAPSKKYNDPSLHDVESAIMKSPKFMKSWPELTGVVFWRQFKVLSRNKTFMIARIIQNVVMGLLMGLFTLQLPFNQYYIKTAVLYFMLMFVGVGSAPLLNDVIAQRNVFYKQARENFFHATSFVSAEFLVGIPLLLQDALLLGILVYFMTGLSLDDNGKHFFIFLFIVLCFGLNVSALIRLLAFGMPDQGAAFAGFIGLIMLMVIFSGALATRLTLPAYYIWIFWWNPLSWAYTSLVQNEFYSATYTAAPKTVDGECVMYCGSSDCDTPYPQMNCGEYFLEARQFITDPAYLWYGVAYVLGITALYLVLASVALTYLRWDERRGGLNSDVVRKTVDFMRMDNEKTRVKMRERTLKAQSEIMDVSAPPVNPSAHGSDIENQRAQTSKGLEFEQVTLSFMNLRYSVEIQAKGGEDDAKAKATPGTRMDRDAARQRSTETLTILNGIDAYAKPYTMTALMGSSGAGKTTLLDVLAGRKTVGKLTGEIYVNGRPKNNARFAQQVGYVEQFGVHLAAATVRESLDFSAALRLPGTVATKEGLKDVVDHIMEILELEPIANRVIGDEETGLSFEETKRLTIAVEMVANPSAIFADEPSSGLESRAALNVLQALRNVAATGRTVIVTVHQPNVAIFNMFDRLLLMRRGGEVVFFDDLGDKSKNLLDYFESFPGVEPCPSNFNPATWMLTVIGAGVSGHSVRDYAQEYRKSSMYKRVLNELDELMPVDWAAAGDAADDDAALDALQDDKTRNLIEDGSAVDAQQHFVTSFGLQLRLLNLRNQAEYWRTPSYSTTRMIILCGLAIMIGLVFVNGDVTNAAAVQSRVSCINILINVTASMNVTTIVPFLFTHRALFYRESSSRMYSSYAYGLALNLAEDPYIFVQVFVTVIPFYWLIGFVSNPIWAFFYYWFINWLFVSLMTYLGVFYSAIMSNPAAAQVLGTLTTQVLGLASGVLILPSVIPNWLIWIYYISPFRWAQEGLIATQFNFMTNPMCNPSGTPTMTDTGTCSDNTTVYNVGTGDFCCPAGSTGTTPRDYVLGPEFLGGEHGYHYDWRWYDVIYLVLLIVVVRVLGVVVTATVNHNKR